MRGSRTKFSLMSEIVRMQQWKYTIIAQLQTVNTQPSVFLLHLPRFHRGERFNGRQTRVFSERHWNGIQCVCESAHSVLFDSRGLPSEKICTAIPCLPPRQQR